MKYKKYIIGTIVAFVLATSCFWLPALLYTLGADDSIVEASQGLAKVSGLFTSLGIGLIILSVYHYRLEKKN